MAHPELMPLSACRLKSHLSQWELSSGKTAYAYINGLSCRAGSGPAPERITSAGKQAWGKQETGWDSPGDSPRGNHAGTKCGDRLYVSGMLALSKRLAQVHLTRHLWQAVIKPSQSLM